jgi:hypothetical protein
VIAVQVRRRNKCGIFARSKGDSSLERPIAISKKHNRLVGCNIVGGHVRNANAIKVSHREPVRQWGVDSRPTEGSIAVATKHGQPSSRNHDVDVAGFCEATA